MIINMHLRAWLCPSGVAKRGGRRRSPTSTSVVNATLCIKTNDVYVAATYILRAFSCPKIYLRPELRPRPHWGSFQRSPNFLAGGEKVYCPSQRTTPPRFRPSIFRPSGLSRSLPTPISGWANAFWRCGNEASSARHGAASCVVEL